MKIMVGVLLVSVVALAGFVGVQFNEVQTLEVTIEQLKSEMQQTKSRIDVAAKVASLDLQAKCAAQAHRMFVDSGYDKEPLAAYTNHFNVKIGKCFIETQYTNTKDAPQTVPRWPLQIPPSVARSNSPRGNDRNGWIVNRNG